MYLQNEGVWSGVHLQRCLDNETSLLTRGILKEVHRTPLNACGGWEMLTCKRSIGQTISAITSTDHIQNFIHTP